MIQTLDGSRVCRRQFGYFDLLQLAKTWARFDAYQHGKRRIKKHFFHADLHGRSDKRCNLSARRNDNFVVDLHAKRCIVEAHVHQQTVEPQHGELGDVGS